MTFNTLFFKTPNCYTKESYSVLSPIKICQWNEITIITRMFIIITKQTLKLAEKLGNVLFIIIIIIFFHPWLSLQISHTPPCRCRASHLHSRKPHDHFPAAIFVWLQSGQSNPQNPKRISLKNLTASKTSPMLSLPPLLLSLLRNLSIPVSISENSFVF